MSKHSPMPWTVVPRLSASENHRGFRIASGNDWYLADVYPSDEDGLRGGANACLIAAAPELLEALSILIAETDGSAIDEESFVSARERARAVIAKATGESS